MKNIAMALVKAQKEFAPALKTNSNPFFKSKYADLSVCIEAVIDALHNNGIALIQRNHDCESGVKIETILLHESGEEFSGGVLHVPALKNDPQAYGSALTYARRYSLMATCGIAPEDDDGNRAVRSTVSVDTFVDKLTACTSLAELQAAYILIAPVFKADPKQFAIINKVKDVMKAKLSGENNAN